MELVTCVIETAVVIILLIIFSSSSPFLSLPFYRQKLLHFSRNNDSIKTTLRTRRRRGGGGQRMKPVSWLFLLVLHSFTKRLKRSMCLSLCFRWERLQRFCQNTLCVVRLSLSGALTARSKYRWPARHSLRARVSTMSRPLYATLPTRQRASILTCTYI